MSKQNNFSFKLLTAYSISAAMFCMTAIDTAFAGKPETNYTEDELLVRAALYIPHGKIKAALKLHGATVVGELPQLRVKRIKVPAQAISAVRTALAKNPNFELVENNYLIEPQLVPNDPFYAAYQGHLHKISAAAGWDISTGSSSITIAVVDTGVDSTNPELKNKLVPGYNFFLNNGDTTDHNGHGTSVAGTVAAESNNGAGIAGVAWQNPVMPIAVAGSNGQSNTFLLAEAIVYATDHEAKVVNISLGGTGYSQTLQDAVNYAWDRGVIVVASAGNSSTGTLTYPAAHDHVLAVSATYEDNLFAPFSNFGPWIDVAAPGTMYTLTEGGCITLVSGTSYSAPLVSGLMGLMLSVNPRLMPIQLQNMVETYSDDLGSAGFDPYFGYGQINMQKTLQAAHNSLASGTDTTDPSVAFSSLRDGDTVNGVVAVGVKTFDDTGVVKVELFIDDILTGTFSATQFSFGWNTTGLADGIHDLRAVAYDSAGNTGTVSISVAVSNSDTESPSVSFDTPSAGATINGTVNVIISSSDDDVTKIAFYVNNVLCEEIEGSITGPVTFRWDSTHFPDGSILTADGTFTLKAEAFDAAGNVGTTSMSVFVENIVEDTTPPSVQFASPVQGDVISGYVDLVVTYSDNRCVTRMDFYKNGRGDVYWVAACMGNGPFSGTWTYRWDSRIMNEDGPATLSVYAHDAAGNQSRHSVDVIVDNNNPDYTPPSGSILINNGAAYTNTTAVTLKLSAADTGGSGLASMRFRNSTADPYSDWEACQVTKSWALTGVVGTVKVYAQFVDNEGNLSDANPSTPGAQGYVDAIIYDPTAPTGSILINNGGASTGNMTVTLNLSATDSGGSGLASMRFRNSSSDSYSAWEPYKTTKSWTLTSGLGTKKVYVQFIDKAENISDANPAATGSQGYVDAIELVDGIAPTGTIQINDGAASTGTTAVTLNLSAIDTGGSGLASMRFRNTTSDSYSEWEPYATTKAWTLTSGAGSKKVYVQFKDAAGNISDANPAAAGSQAYSDGINYTGL